MRLLRLLLKGMWPHMYASIMGRAAAAMPCSRCTIASQAQAVATLHSGGVWRVRQQQDTGGGQQHALGYGQRSQSCGTHHLLSVQHWPGLRAPASLVYFHVLVGLLASSNL